MRSGRTRALTAAALVLVWPAVLFAHTALRKSEPANGALLRAVPRVIRLTFSEAPQLAFTEVELIGPDSQRVALSELRVAAPDSTRVIVADVIGPLRAGRYRIAWQITSADGHPVRGTVAFRIAVDASGLAVSPMDSAATAVLPPVIPDTTAPAEPTPESAAFGADSWPYAVIRLLTFAAVLIVIGAVVFSLIVVPATQHRVPDLGADFVVEARYRAARAAFLANRGLVLLLIARVLAQSYAVRGTPPDASFLAAIIRTPLGWGLVLTAASILTLTVALFRARHARWGLAAVAIIGFALAMSLSGHAVASGRWPVVSIIADVVHVLAAGGWLGALLFVLVAGVPATARLEPLGRGLAVRGMVDAFSPMALTMAAALAITGIVAAVLRIGAWSALTGSEYGRLFLWKIAGVVLVLLAGAYNWKRLRPAMDADRVGTLRRTAAVELALGFVVLIVTAWLVATPPPSE